MFGDFSTRFSGQYRNCTGIVSNYETKVFVNCESRPGSASVDQFDWLGDRNNTHVLFSESSLAQFGLEQFVLQTTTHRDKKLKRCFCKRTEIVIESAWTAPLSSWNEPNGSLFALFVSTHNKRNSNCLAKKLWRLRFVCFLWGTNRVWQAYSDWEPWPSVSILGSEVKHQLIFELLRKYSFWARYDSGFQTFTRLFHFVCWVDLVCAGFPNVCSSETEVFRFNVFSKLTDSPILGLLWALWSE